METPADSYAIWLEDAGIGLTRGTNLFVDTLPEMKQPDGTMGPNPCVALYNNPGLGSTFGFSLGAAAAQVRVQVVTRGSVRSRDGWTLADLIHQNSSVTDYQAPAGYPRILAAMSSGPPAPIGRDPGGRSTFSENVDVMVRDQ